MAVDFYNQVKLILCTYEREGAEVALKALFKLADEWRDMERQRRLIVLEEERKQLAEEHLRKLVEVDEAYLIELERVMK